MAAELPATLRLRSSKVFLRSSGDRTLTHTRQAAVTDLNARDAGGHNGSQRSRGRRPRRVRRAEARPQPSSTRRLPPTSTGHPHLVSGPGRLARGTVQKVALARGWVHHALDELVQACATAAAAAAVAGQRCHGRGALRGLRQGAQRRRGPRAVGGKQPVGGLARGRAQKDRARVHLGQATDGLGLGLAGHSLGLGLGLAGHNSMAAPQRPHGGSPRCSLRVVG